MLFFLEDTRLVRQVPDVAFILRALANVGDHAVWTDNGIPLPRTSRNHRCFR